MTLAVHAAPRGGKPRSRLYQTAQRIARRFEPKLAEQFLAAVRRLQSRIDQADLLSAAASGDIDLILAAVAGGGDLENILESARLARVLHQTSVAQGVAAADVLSNAIDVQFQFNALDVGTVLHARTQAARLIVHVSEDVRESVRIISATGQVLGLTVDEQARAIREVIGLPPNWAEAPMNLGRELREGRFTETRRLSAIDKAQIRSRLAKGTVDEPFIRKMQTRYADSLRNRRALNIARTETLDAAYAGQRQAWRQAIKEGVLPKTARRAYIVTPDDRLRETHAAVPGLNPNGVGMEESFVTPLGPRLGPPIETNCRCGEGLIFPGLSGVL